MKRLRNFLAAIGLGGLLAACGGGMPSMTQQPGAPSAAAPQQKASPPGRWACPRLIPGKARCGVIVVKTGVQPDVAGWGASDLESAYNLPSTSKGTGQIVAIVDAYDNPSVASDLATYRSQFGLPPANFTKYNQEGQQGYYPKGDPGHWGVEIDLDVQIASAACPNCTIYLIEANDDSAGNMAIAEEEAVKLGAHITSNSWSVDQIPESDFDSPGVVYAVASNDFNYGSLEPAEFASVVSVGGTFLSKKNGRYKEIVWPWTGGGCAIGVTKPSWQHDPACTSRTQNDVAAVADDAAEYDSYGYYSGWLTVSGTSISTPLIAGIYGLAGNASSQHAGKKFWTLTKQQRKKYLHTISKGSDGRCGGSYLCTAGTGQYFTYSGPTGWGSPNGIEAF